MTVQLFPNSRFLAAAATLAQCPPDTGIEVAVAGRSNAGKSSVVNVICGRRSLARVSRTPGRTRELIFFELKPDCRLADLPGYGYAKAPAGQVGRWPQLIEAYFARRRTLRGVLIVMDCRHPLQPLDRHMLDFTRAHGLAIHVLLNKSDKLGREQARRTLRRVCAELPEGVSAALLSCRQPDGHEALRVQLQGWFETAAESAPDCG